MRALAHGCGCFLSIPFWLVFGCAAIWAPTFAMEAGLPGNAAFALAVSILVGQVAGAAWWLRGGAAKRDG